MNKQTWIMSEGGALICMEAWHMTSWEGIFGSSIASSDAANDYDRAGRVFDYIETVTIKDGRALVLGEGPLDTSVWRSSSEQTFIVRIFACEENFDLDKAMQALSADVFNNPIETLDFSFSTSSLVLFDSAEQGSEPGKACLTFAIEPGRYKILTQPYDPDPLTSLVLHRFDRVGGVVE